MAKKTGSFKVPFDAKGNMLGYDKAYGIKEWRENALFYAKLKFSHFERGRSAAHAIFIDAKTGARYQMFMTDLGDAMVHVRNGFIEGDFNVAKRGANYGVRLVREASVPELIAAAL